MNKTKFFRYQYIFFFLFLFAIAGITTFSNLPNIHTNFFIPDLVLKNLAHVFAFFFIGFCYLNMVNFGRFKILTTPLLFLLMGTGFSLFDEFQQSFLPSRNVSFMDVFLHILGLIIAFSLFKLISLFRNPSTKSKKKALLISSKETASKLYDYIYNDKNSEFFIKKVLIWDDSSILPSQTENRFYSSFDEIYQTVYHEEFDKIIVIGKTITKEKTNIVKDLAKRTNTEVIFLD